MSATIARSDRGSASAELVLLAPLLVAFAAVLLLGGRLVVARQQLLDATRTAVEAAVIQPTGSLAQAAAATAFGQLASDHLACGPYSVTTATGDFRPGGVVSVDLRCGIALAALGIAGLPGSVTVQSAAAAIIEPYREVG